MGAKLKRAMAVSTVCRRFKYSTYLAATARVSGRVVQLATQIFVSCSIAGGPVPRGECASAVRC